MNYYPFHLGDYAAHTAHLEPMEDLAYRRMLDLYYRTEKALPFETDAICRLIRMKGYEEAVEAVLYEFFENMDEGWTHARCDAEIAKMQDKQAKARASAQASVNARSANAQRTLNERSADVELPTPTPTPTPIPKEEKDTRKRVAPPDGVDVDVWNSFLAVRRAKKAPVSELAMAGITREAEKAGWTLEAALSECVTRGWTAFKAEWVAGKPTFAQQAADVRTTTVPAKPGRDPALAQIEADAKRAAPIPEAVRQQLANLKFSGITQ